MAFYCVSILVSLALFAASGVSADGDGAATVRKAFTVGQHYSPVASYSHAVQVGSTLYVSGALGKSADGKFVDGGIATRTKQALDNIGLVLKEARSSFENVVDVNIILASIDDFADMNKVYAEYFKDKAPARTTWEGKLPGGGLIQISVRAIVGEVTDA